MKHEEKLAFWINIHNALVMHVMILLDYTMKFADIHCLNVSDVK